MDQLLLLIDEFRKVAPLTFKVIQEKGSVIAKCQNADYILQSTCNNKKTSYLSITKEGFINTRKFIGESWIKITSYDDLTKHFSFKGINDLFIRLNEDYGDLLSELKYTVEQLTSKELFPNV